MIVQRFAFAAEENTTEPVAPAARPVSLSVDVPPWKIDEDTPPSTAMANDVATGRSVSDTVFDEVEPEKPPSVSVNTAEIGV